MRQSPEKATQIAMRVATGEKPRAAVRAELPITRARFNDGSPADVVVDEGVTLYRCRHCGRQPATLEEMVRRKCIEVAQQAADDWGA